MTQTKPARFSLGILMASTGLLCVALGLMRDGSSTGSRVAFNVTLFALLVGLLGAMVRRGDGKWAGFAVFGWAYFVMTSTPVMEQELGDRLLTKQPLEVLVERLYDVAPEPQALPFSQQTDSSGIQVKLVDGKWVPMSSEEILAEIDYLKQSNVRWSRYNLMKEKIDHSRRIGHSLLALLFALAGAVLGRSLVRSRRTGTEPTLSGA
jgi:hypothetical protein